MKSRLVAVAAFWVGVCGATKNMEPDSLPTGPELWLEFMGGNVRKDGLRLDLEAIKGAGISGVQFFHIGDRGSGVWPECQEQIPCMSAGWDDTDVDVSGNRATIRRNGVRFVVTSSAPLKIRRTERGERSFTTIGGLMTRHLYVELKAGMEVALGISATGVE